MRAITVRPPWSGFIAAGVKTVENRGRNVAYRGEIAIHGGRAVDSGAYNDPRVQEAFDAVTSANAARGAIVAVAELVDCHDAEQPHPADATCCWPWGDRRYGDGPAWHLVLRDVRMVPEPVSCRGALPIGWTVPADVEAQVRAQLAGVVTG